MWVHPVVIDQEVLRSGGTSPPCPSWSANRGGEQVGDACWTDPVEEHRSGTLAKRAVKTLPLSVRISSGTPWVRSAHAGPHRPAGRSPGPRPGPDAKA